MYGKLNYYIGARAKEEGRKSMFPDIDVSSSSDYFIYTNLDNILSRVLSFHDSTYCTQSFAKGRKRSVLESTQHD